jgi:hypothetical protein
MDDPLTLYVYPYSSEARPSRVSSTTAVRSRLAKGQGQIQQTGGLQTTMCHMQGRLW